MGISPNGCITEYEKWLREVKNTRKKDWSWDNSSLDAFIQRFGILLHTL
jgi:DNA-binding IclR family transcriptional regulator